MNRKGYKNHIFFDKIRKGKDFTTLQKVQLPNLKGMSGCGIWDIQGYDLSKRKQKIKLVGIFIEVNHGYTISTKIDFAIELIKFHFKCFKLPTSSYFYLQDAYLKDWVDNTMVFLEVDDVGRFWKELVALDLPARYEGLVRLTPIRVHDWGRECFLHDPSGILWHFGEFSN